MTTSIVRALGAQGGLDGGGIPQAALLEAQLEMARGRRRAANAALDRVAESSSAIATQYRAAFGAAALAPVDSTALDALIAAVMRAPTWSTATILGSTELLATLAGPTLSSRPIWARLTPSARRRRIQLDRFRLELRAEGPPTALDLPRLLWFSFH